MDRKFEVVMARALFAISHSVLQDIQAYIHCKIEELREKIIKSDNQNMCLYGVLKDEHKNLQEKGLTYNVDTPTKFHPNWIRSVLIRVQN